MRIEQRIGRVLETEPTVVNLIRKNGEEKKEIANKIDSNCLFL